ncbi:1-phosphatidylinositol-4-phosphate 5-kinase [Cryptococcus gattii EJB2]|uniref:1-phosphatidylinositol-4-phosphate 5-kinase n=1 Tax=Cryptococcus gattii EJB2 TaxID=1296103 RepID=A0ABR5BVY9_9TREE|nr:1-phosphatidylinositol-4-phosphate 5-kinase [Cryptococcus gattii EJB2]KJE00167.1 1-phosphatidylinositol-4-phosphate 5-kinase [Cryptococcus gattii NT-10]
MSTSSLPDTHSSLRQTPAVLSSPTLTAHWTHHDQDDGEVDVLRIKSSSPRINPFHLLSHPDSPSSLPPLPPNLQNLAGDLGNSNSRLPPVHITKVSANEVEIKSHSPEPSNHRNIIGRIGAVFKKDTNELDAGFAPSPVIMQGPPPSPPLSEAGLDESVVMSENTDETPVYHSTAAPVSENRPTIATGFTSEPSEISPAVLTPPMPFSARRVSSSSTSSRAGSLTLVRSGRLAPQRDGESTGKGKDLPSLPHESDAKLERRDSSSSLLSPTPQLCRRSTVGSLNLPSAPRSPLMNANAAFASPSSTPPPLGPPNAKGDRLDSAILAQEEHIRRERIERLERRQKKASITSDSDPEPRIEEKPKEKPKEKEREETKVLVGNLIGEDHVNYVLMYNMLTGIRIGVSRCQAKIKRPITDDDYTARHKFSFDIVGNELTPSAKYDFKFKDYAPWVFRELRDDHFHLDPADYLLSLTAKYILSELGSPGKSGSFFYFSRDYRFIIKTISHSEHKFLRSILKDYHQHVKENPHTLLSRFYGLHRVKLPRGPKIHFVIMNNLFPPHRDIHETYDLKGSSFGREYPEEKAAKNPRATLKDKNWVNRGRMLEFGPEKRALLTEQLRRDMEFLKRIKVMDYSLLVGIHNMERGNRDNLRKNQLSVFHPEVTTTKRRPSTKQGPSEASNVRKVVRRSDPKSLDVTSQLPSEDSADRKHFIFYQDEGGFRATDDANQALDTIYYLGVIDICTPYNTLKKIEHFWKSMTEDRHTISCVDPVFYGQRFYNFLRSVMRGGDKSLRPIGLEQVEPSEKPEVGQGMDNREMPIGGANGTHYSTVQDGQQPSIVGHLKTD